MSKKGYAEQLCPQTKMAHQKRRLKQSHNPHKDNQCGPYANLLPFHLLTEVLIPSEVFE